MKKLAYIFFLTVLVALASCTNSSEKVNRPSEWIGNWQAEWETPPEAYPGVDDMEFYMDGMFAFTDEDLTVTNNGYPGCIFAVDTLKHTQFWKISNDTLITYNDESTPGMTYKITSKEEGRVKLQLMEDIFVTLSKQ
ncbi:MAG: hypothetical protein Tsb0034_16970 [Ekhidna sp.]